MSMSGFNWTLARIAHATEGELHGVDLPVSGVSTDTRSIREGDIFIALAGENFDGHRFVPQAVEHGAVAVIVSQPVDADCAQIIVKDTRLALGMLASAWRKQFTIPLIAVTGSNGKTTVKEMITAIMSVRHNTLATQGNLNNDIGVPLTLLRLHAEHQCAVIEMGANHAGEIAYLTKLAAPQVAVITNAGPAHLEGFGSLQGVAQAKGEIYSGLTGSGVAVVNDDDQFAAYWRGLCAGRTITGFGLQQTSDVTASWHAKDAASEIHLQTGLGEMRLTLHLPGRHNVMNALAASAAAIAAGATLDDIRSGLEGLHSVAGRLQIRPGKSGSRIIDDTYNANPGSLRVALEVLQNFAGRHFLALGDMGELGGETEILHRNAGIQAREHGVSRLYTVGKLASRAAESFGQDAQSFADQPALIDAIEQELAADVTLLVKGSRLAHMERVVQALSTNGESA